LGSLLITNAQIIASAGKIERGWLLTREGKIAAFGVHEAPDFEAAQIIDGRGLTLLPGFIDVHVHGAVGCETMDGDADGIRQMARFYAQHGTTSFLPTTWTDSRERITAALEVVTAIQGSQENGATILGVHLEGPYINVAKTGAQNPSHVRRAEREEALSFLDTGVIRLAVAAPEFEENHWFIRECVKRGIAVSAAHTSATYEQMKQAVALGVTHTTHTYNAMLGLGHREPGTVGAALTLPEIACELIADNIHVHPAAMQILFACKGRDGVILITDAVRGAGMSDGEYQIDERTVMVKDGAVRLPDGTLAGSTLTMDKALWNFMKATGQPVEVVWPASSLNAARAIGVSDRKGSIEIGKDADFVLADDDINIHLTVVEGRVVFQK
jgi:N-acetylglucosamine-6-phosphate deacetylase